MMDSKFDFDSLMRDTIGEKQNKRATKTKKGSIKPKNNKGSKSSNENVKPIKPSKVVMCIVIGLVISSMIFLLVGGLYTKYVRFPSEEKVEKETTGMYALGVFEDDVHNLDLPEKYYLYKESVYANSVKEKLDFINTVVSTVRYEPDVVNAKNVYGNDLVDKESRGIITRDSYVVEGEEVTLHYIDYTKIVFDEVKLAGLIQEYNLAKDDVSYANDAVLLFCKYLSNEGSKLPTTSIKRSPFIVKDGDRYVVQEDEDIYLDQLLFSSDEFKDCEMRFTEALGTLIMRGSVGEQKNTTPIEKPTEKSKNGNKPPATEQSQSPTEPVVASLFQPSDEWKEWNALSKSEKEETPEPLKYGKMTMSMNWCGAYYLENEYYVTDDGGNRIKEKVSPQLGNGTFESPASISTPVVTSVLSTDKKGNLVEDPIRVELVDFGASEEALTWFQSKDVQNRGYTLDSEVQYAYYIFKVTNLSNKVLTVSDNSSLCDKNINLSSRTGTIFGLTDTLTLKPDESGYIESWGRSTELNKKYVIWGKDFERRKEPVWFRVLAGDLEDSSEDKGVHLIERVKKISDIEETFSDS